jgi:hypothetical protein
MPLRRRWQRSGHAHSGELNNSIESVIRAELLEVNWVQARPTRRGVPEEFKATLES